MKKENTFSVAFAGSGTTVIFNEWSIPIRVNTIELNDSIEMVYKQTSAITNSYFNSKQEEVVFKIVYSCKDGKWNKSEPIYGKIIPAIAEYYEF